MLTPICCSCTLGPVELCMYWFCVVCQCVRLYYCIQQLLYCVTVRYTVEHNHHLALMVDIGFCLQQSLDCLGVSLPSSCLQRNITILCESMRNKRTVIASGDHCCKRERERERESERERENDNDFKFLGMTVRFYINNDDTRSSLLTSLK